MVSHEKLSISKKLEMSLDDIGKAMDKETTRKDSKFKRLPARNNFVNQRKPRYNFANDRKSFRGGRQKPKFIVRVSNLDHTIMQKDLMELFSSVGEVIKAWVDYDNTDRSKGTGGCMYKFAEDAERAIEKFNGSIIEGKAIKLHGEILIQDREPFRQRNNFNRFQRNRFSNNLKSPW
ncbi:hypothetical protein BEWA_017920 [Theileria equi strain WA]|uniref:RRM domain-containing protein n=1 Tax=Theileria equi strain WA TaxID=1537102 RepID=L0AVB6_THEEQ|nr:hypothetical protein BEWA_017920 [Theileria equi strain WA]AFZ78951.1 hypothetical protein BEWA_017920 [Theileria equi strain WA]|eukprot:XP_004828617.1 hypothetical protein BEWA_017920 [Theileria equi strain WA]